MSSLVLLRWIMPARRPYHSPRELIRTVVAPSVRSGGWLYGPETTHHVSDQGDEAWLTVVTPIENAPWVEEDMTELLMSRPSVETSHDALLDQGAAAYRAALQKVTHVGLDVLDDGGMIPLTEFEAVTRPSEAAPVLVPFLNATSGTYRSSCLTYDSTERFWLDFFRQGPAPKLSCPGRWLWNLAG